MTAGVLLHLPMYIRSTVMNFHIAGMAADNEMLFGMVLIVGGTIAAFYGLLPAFLRRESPDTIAKEIADVTQQAAAKCEGKPDRAHCQLLVVLILAVVIDSMKPASLGFVVPSIAVEYGLSRAVVALFPFSALVGLTIGSYVWGAIADHVAGVRRFCFPASCSSAPQSAVPCPHSSGTC